MFSSFICLFDACVLYPAPVRDLIIELSQAEFYRAKWAERIHDEWISSLLSNRPDLDRKQDDFFLNQSGLQPGPFLAAIKRIRQSLKKPSKAPEEYLDVLRYALRKLGRHRLSCDRRIRKFCSSSIAYGYALLSKFTTSWSRAISVCPSFLSAYILRKHSLTKTAAFLDNYIDVI